MSSSPARDRIAGRVSRTAQRIISEAQRTNVPLADLASVRVPWMSIRSSASASGGSEAEILIYEEIGGSAGVQAEQFAQEIAAIDADVIKVRINSPGGSVFDGLAIFNSLNHHPARIETYVDGIAASAASIIAMAGNQIVMMPGSEMMIHDASMVADGNAAELTKAATFANRQSDNIAGVYAQRGGGDTAAWRELMLAETWMFADEAVDMGLADHAEVLARPSEVDEGATRSFDLARFGYRYEGRRNAPAPGTETRRRRAVTQVRDRATLERPPVQAPGYMTSQFAERAVPFDMEPSKDGLTLEGYAAVFNSPTRIADRGGAFDEVILPGAFRNAIGQQKPVLMFEHGKHPLIGSMPLGVITRIEEDSTGLHIEAALSDNWLIQPVRDAVRDRAVTGMSFRFGVDGGETWERRAGDVDLRTIHDFAVVPELGPVVFPAYEPTTATVRSLVERLPDLTRRPVARGTGGGERTEIIRQRAVESDSLRLRGILR